VTVSVASVADRPALPVRRAGRIPTSSLADHAAMLLEVARRLFYANGFEGTSIEAIARAARVSPKTIYARYGGKGGLFAAAMSERADTVMDVLREPVADDVDVRTALVEFAVRLLTLTTSDEALTMQRLVFSEAQRFPEFGRAFYEAGPKRGTAVLAAFLSRATAAGLLAIDETHAAAEFFVGALLGSPIRLALLGAAFDDEDERRARAEFTAAAFLRAFERC
jgi:AcrR family transcriptional regulator